MWAVVGDARKNTLLGRIRAYFSTPNLRQKITITKRFFSVIVGRFDVEFADDETVVADAVGSAVG